MKRELLYKVIYDDLLKGIKDGVYPPGSKLPSEKDLSEQYGVSRITSKKSLEMLTDEKLITRIPGKGSYVLSAEGESVQESAERQEQHAPVSSRRTIGVIMDSFGPIFGCDLLFGIERECQERNCHLLLKCTCGSMEAENRIIRELVDIGVAGIILMCVQGETYNAEILRLSIERFPVVLVDRELRGLPIPFVGTDNYRAAKELVDCLIEKGHRNICFLSHTFLETSTVANRFEGYRDSCLEHGLLTNESLWVTDMNSILPGITDRDERWEKDGDRIQAYIRENPQVTAFFASNHEIGIIVYDVLKRMGLTGEKEVVFFDGYERKVDSNPRFTHVKQDEYLIGTTAVNLLMNRIDGEEVPGRQYIPYRVIRGEEAQQGRG